MHVYTARDLLYIYIVYVYVSERFKYYFSNELRRF